MSDVDNDDGKRLQPAVVTRSLTALTDDSPEARKKLKSPADKIDKAGTKVLIKVQRTDKLCILNFTFVHFLSHIFYSLFASTFLY